MREEKVGLPTPDLLRKAIDVCWSGQNGAGQTEEIARLLEQSVPHNGQPIFSSNLSLYLVGVSLTQQALEAFMRPEMSHASLCSEFSLDFHLQLLYLRHELAGIGPDFQDPERDIREFEADPGSLAEAEHQIADALALRAERFDVAALRADSAEHGRRVLEDVVTLLQRQR